MKAIHRSSLIAVKPRAVGGERQEVRKGVVVRRIKERLRTSGHPATLQEWQQTARPRRVPEHYAPLRSRLGFEPPQSAQNRRWLAAFLAEALAWDILAEWPGKSRERRHDRQGSSSPARKPPLRDSRTRPFGPCQPTPEPSQVASAIANAPLIPAPVPYTSTTRRSNPRNTGTALYTSSCSARRNVGNRFSNVSIPIAASNLASGAPRQ